MSIVKEVEKWLDEIVIGLELCPFAKHPRKKQQIGIHIAEASSIEELMLCLVEQCIQLEKASCEKLETTLLVIPNFLGDFEDYLDCLFLAEQLVETQGWQGVFQIASFHPQYQFEGTQKEDTENLTNRSPYPIFHILREQSISQLTEAYGDTSIIPERNKETIKSLPLERRKKIFSYLKDCYN